MRFRRAVGVGAAVLALLVSSRTVHAQPGAYFGPVRYIDLQNRLGAHSDRFGSRGHSGRGSGECQRLPPELISFPGQTIIDRTGVGVGSEHATSVGLNSTARFRHGHRCHANQRLSDQQLRIARRLAR